MESEGVHSRLGARRAGVKSPILLRVILGKRRVSQATPRPRMRIHSGKQERVPHAKVGKLEDTGTHWERSLVFKDDATYG